MELSEIKSYFLSFPFAKQRSESILEFDGLLKQAVNSRAS
jgi:hypothetical protein